MHQKQSKTPLSYKISVAILAIAIGTGSIVILTAKAAGIVGDINGDGVVGINDLSILLSDWGMTGTSADINSDGTVNITDLSMLLSNWAHYGGCYIGDVEAPCIGGATTGGSGWGTPVFDDEFNGSSLNTNNWASSWFNGGSMNNVTTVPGNVSVSGGNLILTLSSSSQGALVSSNPHNGGGAGVGFEFGDGYYVEGRIYFPGSEPNIYNWPAFWTDPQSWPSGGEIDIAEGLNKLTSNYHSSSGANNSGPIGSGWASGWHTYAVDRENGQNTIYWDGQVVRTYTTNDAGALNYIIVNVGNSTGSSCNCGGPSVYGTGSQVKVDYVRVWKK